jgi:hypothetical protein
MPWKKIIIGCSTFFGLLVVLIVVAGIFVCRSVAKALPGRMEIPSSLVSPTVVKGGELFSKSIFLDVPQAGSVTDIYLGELDPAPGLELGIAGSTGAVFADVGGTIKSSLPFSGRADQVDIIDIENDGICEFMNRGSWALSASVFDHSGNIIWEYGGMPGVDDMAAGDVDGDGKLEFAVGFNGGGGVRLLETDGQMVWKKPDGNVWHVEMVDTNRDGMIEIVHSNAAGQITVRDGKGNILSRNKPSPYFSDFSLSIWPAEGSKEYALLAEDDIIWLFDYDGKVMAQMSAPQCGTLGEVRGVWFRPAENIPEHYAVLVAFKNWNRSILYIYNSSKELVYQEILPETCSAIAAIPVSGPDSKVLLVGGQGKVWKYSEAVRKTSTN